MALSRFGSNWEEFYDLSEKDFIRALKDKEKYESTLLQSSVTRAICETIRMQTLALINAQIPKGKPRIWNAKKLWRFNWEEEEGSQTREQMKNTMRAIASRKYKGDQRPVRIRREEMMQRIKEKKRKEKLKENK